MYKVTSLDIGLTDNCNAGCPQCPRTDSTTFKKVDWLEVGELYLEDIKQIIPPNQMSEIRRISLCGSYGDPLVARDIIPIINYFFEHSPKLNLSINTNGSMKNTKWWHSLGQALKNKNVIIQFGIDGVNQEQHERYRKRTNFDKILKHAQIVQMYGVRIAWQYLIFEYNKDDLETAKMLAKKYKFDQFTHFVTNRPDTDDHKKVTDQHNVDQTQRRESFNSDTKKVVKVECLAENLNEVHINAKGEVIPCCYLDTAFEMPRKYRDIIWSTYLQPEDDRPTAFQDRIESNVEMLGKFIFNRDYSIWDGRKHTVQGVINNPWWDEFMNQRDRTYMCKHVCGKCE